MQRLPLTDLAYGTYYYYLCAEQSKSQPDEILQGRGKWPGMLDEFFTCSVHENKNFVMLDVCIFSLAFYFR